MAGLTLRADFSSEYTQLLFMAVYVPLIWSPSWFVPASATLDSMSNGSFPSGLAYSIGSHSAAGFRASAASETSYVCLLHSSEFS